MLQVQLVCIRGLDILLEEVKVLLKELQVLLDELEGLGSKLGGTGVAGSAWGKELGLTIVTALQASKKQQDVTQVSY